MINLAVVGLGNWGRRHTASALETGRFNVKRAVSKEPNEVRDFADQHGPLLSEDIEDVLADPEIDAVTLATPHTLHTAQIIMAAEAGKHVLSEKPFALSKSDAARAVAACEKASVVLGLGHDNRHYPAMQELKRLVDSGGLGEVLHIETNISHDAQVRRLESGNIPDPEVARAERNTGGNEYVPTRAWRLEFREAPAGPLIHLGVHRVDAFIHLLGEIEWVFAQYTHHLLPAEFGDVASVLLRFRSGVTGYIGSSLITPMNSRIQIFGTDAWVEARRPGDFGDYVRSSLNQLTLFNAEGESETTACEDVDSVAANLTAYADAIEGTGSFNIETAEMIHNAAVIEALAQAIESGEKIMIG